MNPKQQKGTAPPAAERERPMHTRKSAWKLGWPITRPRLPDRATPSPAVG